MTPPPPPADGIEWGTIAQWVGPWITSGVALLIAIWGRFSDRDEKALEGIREDIEGLTTNVGELYQQDKTLNERMATVETKIAFLPTKEDLHKIALEQATQSEMLRGFGQVLTNLAGSVKAIERAMLEREAKDDRR